MAEIYGLCDPATGELRYIGKANNAAARLKSHMRDMRRRKAPVYDWMRKLARNGKAPRLIVLEVADNWQEAERRLIAEARARGECLLNLADGGDQPHCPIEVRRENGRRLGAIRDDRIWRLKRAVGQALRYGWADDAAKEKLRRAAALAPHLFGEYAAL